MPWLLYLTMILLIYFLAAVAVHAIYLSPSIPSGIRRLRADSAHSFNQEHRIEGIVRALCRELVYRGKSFTMTVVAERKESEPVRIIEKLMLRQGMELSYLSAVPLIWNGLYRRSKREVRLLTYVNLSCEQCCDLE